MGVEELEARIKTLENQIRTLQNIEEIKKLQRAYGYYLEHWMSKEIIDLFSDSPDAAVMVRAGQFLGKEGVRRFFERPRHQENPEYLHQVMQLSGIIDVDPDGKTAKGRWYGFGPDAFPGKEGVSQGWMDGIYENEYVKENGKWKIKILRWCMIFHAPWGESFVPAERRMDQRIDRPYKRNPALEPVGPPEETIWPSGFICPFHFDNPATGRKRLM